MILKILIAAFVLYAYLPALGNRHWFFRTPDFIRLQTLAAQGILLVLFLIFTPKFTWDSISLLIALVATIIYQSEKVLPYSKLMRRRPGKNLSQGSIGILAANVLQTNTQYDRFLKIVDEFKPDVLLTMESNEAWEQHLIDLEQTYEFSVIVPLNNFYGMHLFSKKQLLEPKVEYLVEEDVPSIITDVEVSPGNRIKLICLHPAPPSPTENETSAERDAELMRVGKRIRNNSVPTVVFGDMNDVVWSRVSRLFKKITGMIDPRVGRGFFSTYHARFWLFRFPLDHLFHTRDLFVGRMERTRYFGSDHFGMFYEVHVKDGESSPINPKIDAAEASEVNEIIENGMKNRKKPS